MSAPNRRDTHRRRSQGAVWDDAYINMPSSPEGDAPVHSGRRRAPASNVPSAAAAARRRSCSSTRSATENRADSTTDRKSSRRTAGPSSYAADGPPDEEKKSTPRAAPGVRAASKGKFAFSDTPSGPNAPWRGQTAMFNKRMFCEAAGVIAKHQGMKAAMALWDMRPPRTNKDLEVLLQRAVIKITICEGEDLLKSATAICKKQAEEERATPETRRPGKEANDDRKSHGERDRRSGGDTHRDGETRRRRSSLFRPPDGDSE